MEAKTLARVKWVSGLSGEIWRDSVSTLAASLERSTRCKMLARARSPWCLL